MRDIFMPLHIVSGALSLLLGTYLLLRRKGDKLHRRLGLVFYYGMLVVAFSSLGLAIVNPNFFLAMIGVFTLYLNVTGKRYLVASRNGNTGEIFDWMISFLMMCFALILLFTGLRSLINSDSFGIVALVFGIMSLLMVAADYRIFRQKNIINPAAILMHLQRMCAAYIAALTAFIVVNFPYERIDPSMGFIPWLLPGVIVAPFIAKWSRRYKKLIDKVTQGPVE